MSKWLLVDPNLVNIGKSETLNGVRVNLFIPPHLVPRAVKGQYNSSIKRFVVNFNYMDEGEELESQLSADQMIEVRLGRRSKRIFELIVDVDRMRAREVNLTIQNIQQAATQALAQAVNRTVASQILNNNKPIFNDLIQTAV